MLREGCDEVRDKGGREGGKKGARNREEGEWERKNEGQIREESIPKLG